MKVLVMQSSALPCYLVALKSKYLPQHPTLQNPQTVFPSECEGSIFAQFDVFCVFIYGLFNAVFSS
jgi:hypothetical protein